MGRFDGKVVWITGGGSGIGKAMALEFGRQGARVAVSGRRVERLDDTVQALEGIGAQGLAVPCDVSDDGQVKAAVDAVVEGLGKLDVVVANAGYGVAGTFDTLTDDDWRNQFDVNVFGAISTVRWALPELRKTKGRVALISSVNGMLCIPGMSAYCASKFALRAIGLTLSQELQGSGVSCTSIYPGFVESEIAQVDNTGRFHAERKDKRPAKLMWKAEDAARVSVKAIWKRKREFVFTWHGTFGAFLGLHFPGLVHFVLTRGGVSKQVAKRRK